jgi:3-dehydroquinate synthetase
VKENSIKMKPINVNLESRSYKIHVEHGLLKKTGVIVRSFSSSDKIMILSTATVYRLYGEKVFKSLSLKGFKVYSFLIPDGEEYKNEKHFLKYSVKWHGFHFRGILVCWR